MSGLTVRSANEMKERMSHAVTVTGVATTMPVKKLLRSHSHSEKRGFSVSRGGPPGVVLLWRGLRPMTALSDTRRMRGMPSAHDTTAFDWAVHTAFSRP
jgi:hypothetical protein